MVEAGLQQLREVIVLSSAYETRYGSAGERTGPSVKVIQQDPQGFRLKFDDGKLSKVT